MADWWQHVNKVCGRLLSMCLVRYQHHIHKCQYLRLSLSFETNLVPWVRSFFPFLCNLRLVDDAVVCGVVCVYGWIWCYIVAYHVIMFKMLQCHDSC
jgi:hypothetical protein